jgi:hypothetical protein
VGDSYRRRYLVLLLLLESEWLHHSLAPADTHRGYVLARVQLSIQALLLRTKVAPLHNCILRMADWTHDHIQGMFGSGTVECVFELELEPKDETKFARPEDVHEATVCAKDVF